MAERSTGAVLEFLSMSRSFPTTLTIPRFLPIQPRVRALARLRIAARAALFVGALGAFGALFTPAAFAQAQPSPTEANGPATGAAQPIQRDFDARQKVLDRRTAENDYRYGVAQHNCYSSFFVNHCLARARDQMRSERADIRSKQLALDDEQRAERARQRDQQIALQRAQDAAEAPQRAANEARNQQAYEDKQRQHALDEAQRAAEAPQRAANEQAYEQKQRQHALDEAQRGPNASQRASNQAAYDQKQADFQRQLEQAREEGAQKEQERQQRAARFQQKQEDAAKHKADVEERQRQAAQKAQQKQQQEQQQQIQQQRQQQGQ